MKFLLTLILTCMLLWTIPLFATADSLEKENWAAKSATGCDLPGDISGSPIPSGDGHKLFYSTGSEIRVWDQELGIHRRIRELASPQQLTGVLLEEAILQCESEDTTYFYAASDGQLLKTFPGTIRVDSEKDGYSVQIPLGDLTLRVFGEYNAQPQMVLGESEPEPYYTADSPDMEGLAACREAARKLEEEYGIRILLWDDVPKAAAVTGEHLVPVIRRELTVLSQRLSVFPKALLQETAAHFPELTLCLVRQRPEDLPCCQYWDGDNLCIILESGCSGQDLYHGLFHAMETHILSNSKAFDRWNELNPAGFVYDQDYTVNAVRDSGIYLLGEDRSFLNRFSMSFPREDRAEIFAHAMMPGNRSLFQTEILKKKLSTLCAGIRDAFRLENSEGTLLWEQYLR